MIAHVALETRPADVAACTVFFGLLGFAEVVAPATLRDRAVWLEHSGTQVHLLLTDEPVVEPAGHVAVVAGDYAGTLAALRAAGHPVDERTAHWGAPRCFTEDPAGHRVEVMQWPPPFRLGSRP